MRFGILGVAACFVGAAVTASAASPIEELYGKHVTCHIDFDDGKVSDVGGCSNIAKDTKIGEGGLLGSKGLVGGGISFLLPEGQKVFDTTKPGTQVFWLKLVKDFPDPLPNEPGETLFGASWTPQKRLLVFKQGNLKWGEATIDTFFQSQQPDGKLVSARVGYGGSLRRWEKGTWHMIVSQWRPDGVAHSFDGEPFKKVAATMQMGPFHGPINWRLYDHGDAKTANYVMDEISLLDFGMSDEQVAALYKEYKAAFKQVPVGSNPVSVTIEKMGPGKSANVYDVVIKVENTGTESLDLIYNFGARPDNSQPVKKKQKFRLASKSSKVLTVSGPVLDEEEVDTVLRITDADGHMYYNRRRVFSPNVPEPDWMREPPKTSFRFAYYPYENTIHSFSDISACENFAKAKELKYSIFRKGEDQPIATKSFAPDRETGKKEIFWRKLPDLDGEYVCRFEAVGVTGGKAEQKFVRRHFDWEHNKLGKSGAVPDPFTPVEKVGNHVKVVLRDHTIGEYGLWDQVSAAGKDVLAQPMKLVSSKPLPKVTATSEWDVDGMMLWKLTLPPGEYGKVKLVIPMKEERAWLFHPVTDGLRSNFAGKIPAGEGKVWDSVNYPRNSIVGSYLPYIWLGGPLRGIAVFGENDKGWIVNDETPCFEIVRKDGIVMLVLNLVQQPTTVAKTRTIKIGFQATPVKPMPKNWRGIPHGTLIGACYYWGGFWDSHCVEPFDGTDEFFRVMAESRKTGVFNEEYLERAVASYPFPYKQGTPEYNEHYARIRTHFSSGLATAAHSCDTDDRFVFYTNGRGVHYGDRKQQGATFCNEWTRFEYMDRDFTLLSRKAYDLDPVESYRDYDVWWYERMLGTGACDHLYWDDVFCQSSFNLVQTDAYRLPSGQIQPSSGIFNMREQVKRCAVLQKEMGKDCRGNWVHMTNTAMAPICAFAGVNYDWEDISGTKPHQVKYPKDYILACTIGRQFGNRVGIMGYFDLGLDKNGEEYQWLAHTGAGVMLTHELRWNESGHLEYQQAHDKLCDWGYRTPKVDVWNYWDEDVKYPLDIEGLDVSSIAMAKKSAREAMICVCNFEDRAGEVTIRPDGSVLGLGPSWKATDALTGQPVELNRGVITVKLDKYDWKLIKLN